MIDKISLNFVSTDKNRLSFVTCRVLRESFVVIFSFQNVTVSSLRIK